MSTSQSNSTAVVPKHKIPIQRGFVQVQGDRIEPFTSHPEHITMMNLNIGQNVQLRPDKDLGANHEDPRVVESLLIQSRV
ncbi:MAG: hypothetical protein M4579_007296 [Chaenotheca gracillima]|nr:MAG: hypothetical protein M4579_007296 [Chaenotheca gracillima]